MKAFLFLLLCVLCSPQPGHAQAPDTTAAPEKPQVFNPKGTGGDLKRPAPAEEVLPVYPGGDEALQQFLEVETDYPEEALQVGTAGKVYVGFIVEKNGDVDSVWIMRGLDTLLDAEAMRVVRLLDGWSPALVNGTPARYRYSMPFVFELPAEKPDGKKYQTGKHTGRTRR
jgi:TonB family protein